MSSKETAPTCEAHGLVSFAAEPSPETSQQRETCHTTVNMSEQIKRTLYSVQHHSHHNTSTLPETVNFLPGL